MNPISVFFVKNIVAIFFFYGLAFFALGLALALASRRASEFTFVRAIRPLALFGLLHGGHEWIEMFQKIAEQSGGYSPTPVHELLRLLVLVASFVMLFAFGALLLWGHSPGRGRVYTLILAMVGVWGGSSLAANFILRPTLLEGIALADVLARYSLGIPGALLSTWALMAQQRTFRDHALPQFGRDLVWCATALFFYGVIGQVFVRPTILPPSSIINSDLFLRWFGIPVQLFRGLMAMGTAVFMVRTLDVFELESRRRLAEANQAKLTAQMAALEKERQISQQMEQLNLSLRSTAHELGLLLELSNLLTAPLSLAERLQNALQKIVHSLAFPEAGMILLVNHERRLQASAALGLDQSGHNGSEPSLYQQVLKLAEQSVFKNLPMCRHMDGRIIEFLPEQQHRCRDYQSPVVMISLPLPARQGVIGSLALTRTQLNAPSAGLSLDEFKLILGIAQQLGLSLENARLYQEAQERESTLGELLHQVVGAQEAERQRIARELHDATGQSLTAIALGLRGVESLLASDMPGAVEQVKVLKAFSTDALGELRQIIAGLRPSQLDDLGLAPALQWYAQEFEKRRAIHTEFVLEGPRVRLPSEYEIVLFRIAQEGLTNIARHARASQAEIKLSFTLTHISLTIRDNGQGFDPKEALYQRETHRGWGLIGIQERALLLGGQYQFDAAPGRGSCIQVKVPLPGEARHVEDTTAAG